MNKVEIDIMIGVLKSLIKLAETLEPNLAQNKFIQEINTAIAALQALGL